VEVSLPNAEVMATMHVVGVTPTGLYDTGPMNGRRWAAAAVTSLTVTAGVLLFYLSVYAIRGYDQPLGYDTARYLWRTSCVAAGGLSELRRCAPAQAALPSRVGYPIVSLLLSSLLPLARYPLAAALPAIAATVIALGAAALVSWSLQLGARAFAVIAVVVGASPMVVAMADPEGYADTMLALGIGVVGFLAIAVVAESGKGFAPAMGLLAVAAVVHSATGAIIGAIVVAVAVLYLPEALSKRRTGGGLRRSVPSRLGTVLGGSIAAWALVMGAVVGGRPDSYHVPIANLEAKFHTHWPRLGLPIGVPAAAAGAWILGRKRSWGAGMPARRRFLLTLLMAWIGIVALALVAWFAGWKLPVHRFLLLSLPVPVFGGIALLWLADRVSAARSGLRPAVLVAGCIAVAAAGYVLWTRNSPPVLRSARLDAARAAADYVAGLPPGQAVTVVTDQTGANPDALAQTFRVVLPQARIASVRFLPRVPKRDPANGTRVVLLVKGYSREFAAFSRADAGRLAAPDVLVLAGPAPQKSAVAPPLGPRLQAGLAELLLWGILSILLLGALGVGWSMALPGLRPVEVVAVAPGIGLAILVIDGLILDLIGARIGDPAGVVVVLASGLVSAILAIRRRRFAAAPVGGV
jgi:hypothetical protein